MAKGVAGIYPEVLRKDDGESTISKYHVMRGRVEKGQVRLEDAFSFSPVHLPDFKKAHRGVRILGVAPQSYVFERLVKLPPVDESKIKQIIQYEAQQNVPFPIDEMEWGSTTYADQDVLNCMLAAIKKDNIGALFGDLYLSTLSHASHVVASLYAQRTQGTVALAVQEDRFTSLTFVKDGQLLFNRSIPVSIAPRVNPSTQEAVPTEQLAARLRAEMNRSFNFARSQLGIDATVIWTPQEDMAKALKETKGMTVEYVPGFTEPSIPSDANLFAVGALYGNPINILEHSKQRRQLFDVHPMRAFGRWVEERGKGLQAYGKSLQ